MDHARAQPVACSPATNIVPSIVAYAIGVPSAIAMVISAYLAYATFTMSDVAGCGSGSIFDCGHVLHSKWSKAAGIPVSVFAILTHLTLITGLFVTLSQKVSDRLRAVAAKIVFVAAIAAAVAALYFISLQVFVLEHLCSYCMVAHVCGLMIGTMALWKLSVEPISEKAKLAAVAMAGIAVLATIQIASAEPPKFKIQSFVPPVEKPSLQDGPDDQKDGDPGSIFSAPGEPDHSLDSGESDIFAAPVEDGASLMRTRSGSGQLQISTLLLTKMFVLGKFSVASNCLIISPAAAQDKTKTGSELDNTEKDDASNAQAKASRLVPMIGGTVKLKASDWPLIGSPNAKHIFVEMFDYTCEHCRATNAAIEKAKEILGDELAVVTLPVPMNQSCNPTVKTSSPSHAESCELSRLAVAVWRLDKDQFAKFHRWMFDGPKSPIYSEALAKAGEMVGKEVLQAELAKTVCSQYISRNVELYKRVGGGPIPKMIFKKNTIVGEFTSGESLTDLIKDYTSDQP